MFAAEAPLGCSALLRVAGLPIRYWLEGASPQLFGMVEALERSEKERRTCAIELAERIGAQLVPKTTLSRDDRAFLLSVRRCLHRGDLIAKVSREQLLTVCALADADAELVQSLVTRLDQDRAIAMLSTQVETDLAQEHARLLLLPEQICHESRVAQALLAAQEPEEPRLASQVSPKIRRHRCEYAWRSISRATTGSTPRGWLSHVALLAIETPGSSLPPPAVTERFTAQWAENVRAPRLALANPPEDWPTSESRLAANPLRWDVDGRLVCIVLDKNREQTQVSVQRTLLLDGIFSALDNVGRSFGEIARAVGCVNQDEWLALRGFVRHLVVLGVLQPSAPPLIRLERWATPGQTFTRATETQDGHGGWIDVYRYAETGLSGDLARDVQQGMSQAFRLLSLSRDDTTDAAQLALPTSTRSWSLTEIIRDELSVADEPTSNPEDTEPADDRALPASATSRFAQLARDLVERAGSATEVTIGTDLLDQWGAANSVLNWPVDCLVRVPTPGSGFTAVFEDSRPPGVLDSRFADTLSDMHGVIPQVEAYRAFLRRLEQLTGFLFVELLAPPLTDGAANAVRRPIYTSAWTGDPHAEGYLRGGADPGTYIPMSAISIRRIEGRLRAEVKGQPIWPIYHATRTFERPWSQVARILLATAPIDSPSNYERMSYVLRVLRTLLPQQTAVPRISVSGGIVLAPAQWRVPFDQLWDRSSSGPTKLRAMIRLRDRYSLPRWVYLIRDDNKPPMPCDLESIHVFRTIERYTTGSAPLTLIEMLPAPDQFLTVDRAHRSGDRLASQLQLRLPCDESATTLADRVAPSVLATLISPRRKEEMRHE